tara:strand:- start:206 stop:739 length:534 start_codon:yes stop_codon:yes gene_type:complete
MSGLLFLTADDFSVIKNDDPNKNDIMINNIDNFSLILFYSTHCQHCQNIIPIMKQLPGTVTGCQFGMINVSKNKKTIRMSKNTITPLTYVPYIILYYNRRPYMRYDGNINDITEIQSFVHDVANSILQQVQLQNEQGGNNNNNDHVSIPEYCIARPTKGGENEHICYVNFSDAYYKQ